MKRLMQSMILAGVAAYMLDTTSLLAQPAGGGGNNRGNRGNRNAQGNGNNANANNNRANFDPAQMRQRMMDRYKETLGVTNDDEWKIVEERIQKVMDAQRDSRGGGGMGMMGGRRGGAAPGGATPQDANATQGANPQNQRRGGNRADANPAATELQKALDENAAATVINDKLASYRDSRKAAEAKLEQAQAELQKVVTRKQEARLVLMGLLK